ncbi:hypothetical protein EKO27_g10460 [Xylaria grammica]|uniref:Extracellular membrane protein CFEM domain-containing protein n=1 Tax=Xylaria grammica TaxID=363999 RepID=A0A439CRB2_9PEZI|nr:hypothetical protein F5X98DRAFT_289370 [Xylaria grammica]RWA04642.1 hypothetical protein EKO27_g10460 [Xylaria grammica]
MRFTSFIVAGLFAVAASAQSSTSSTTAVASTTVSVDPAQSSLASEIEQCLAQCDDSDTKCRANCIAVPSPDNQNVNATTACVAECPQGNGTAADNQAYSDCVQKCIGDYYYTTTGTPNLATSKAGNADGSASVTEVATTIVSGGSTIVTSVPHTVSQASDGPSSTSSSEGAAAVYGPVGTGLTLFGLLAGFVAL